MFLTLTLAALAAVGVSRPALTTPSPRAGCGSKAGDSIEAVQLHTSDDLTLAATFYAPTIKGNVKVPGAVILHAPGQDKSQVDELAKYLQRKGFGVLAVDLRGHGASASEACDWKTLDETGQATSWNLALRDVQAATEYLRGRNEIHSNNLSLVGVGGGASLAVRQALDDDTVRALVLIAPAFENYGFSIVGGLELLPADTRGVLQGPARGSQPLRERLGESQFRAVLDRALGREVGSGSGPHRFEHAHGALDLAARSRRAEALTHRA
jgi:pimeloyl-ACP methyl ester carboxylesterase